jgi:hypothetical protein
MKLRTITTLTVTALVAGISVYTAKAADENFSARLEGLNEVPPNNTAGLATFNMTISSSTITFTLKFQNLSTSLQVSHLHFAPTKVAGNVMIFLCGGGGQPACPATMSGTINGTITAANVTGPASQGIDPGNLNDALEQVRNGNAYANMHTTKFPGGEIRGQVVRGKRGGEDD